MRRDVAPLGCDTVVVEVEEIPVFVDHVPFIIGPRRKLVFNVAQRAFAYDAAIFLVALGDLHFGVEHVAVRAVPWQVLGVIEDQAGVLELFNAQAAPNDLLEQADALGGAQDGNELHVCGIKTSGQHRDVDQILDPSSLEVFDDLGPLFCIRLASDNGRHVRRQAFHALIGVLDRSSKDHHATQECRLGDHVRNDGGGLAALPVVCPVDGEVVKLPTGVQLHVQRLVPVHGWLSDCWLSQEALLDQFVRLNAINAGLKIRVFGLCFRNGLSVRPEAKDVPCPHAVWGG